MARTPLNETSRTIRGIGAMIADRPMTEKEWTAQQAAARKEVLAQVGARLATVRDTFAILIDQVAEDVYAAMQTQGFWSGDQDSTGQKLALIHSEVSEWLEADRKGIDADDKIPDYTGPEAEAADTIIRIFDLAARHDMRLGAAIIDKMLFNLTREPKHGKKY